ncbi:MAG: UvrD-helicase domain-containing protein [Anaerolineales bacterium]|jgi:DNA helicase-2/ATP-dependent DNA helicase PcrA|nr:UvrD-helicase domain-containing protein [Anaerolineales bacterium]
MDFLDKLNPAQKKAVSAGDGPILVMAGPGSGKTRVLTQRIAYLIAYEGVRPYQMLAVTFTNKAAREMGQRVEALLGPEMTSGLFLGTFHSICARLLRREADKLPVSSDFVIFDADDQQNIVKRVTKELNLNDKLYRPVVVHAAISKAKNELIGPDKFPVVTYRDEAVKRIYGRYQEMLRDSNAVDFDDLLLMTANLLADHPDVREKYAQRFRHVLVDEFQDTNQAQYTLIKHLSSAHGNIFCVGDGDQSIYAWRGADYRNIQRFEKDFPGAQVILLEQNYRSKQIILDAAMAVIDKAHNRRKKKLFSELGPGERINYYEAFDDYGEASFVVDSIAQLIASRRFDPGECAVMYRTNAQSRLMEEAFLAARLPYKLVGAQRFYGRREVKDMIAFLRLVHNPADEISLDRVINIPPRGIGDKTLLTLHSVARGARLSPGSVLLDLARGSDSPYFAQFSGRAGLALAGFGANFSAWRGVASAYTVPELFDKILADIRYQDHIEDGSEEGKERWENVVELRRLAQEYESRTLSEFLENVALISDQDTLSENQNAPTLLTLHAAKGLEFGAVFIVGLDDGTLPHSRSFDEPEQMEEERRLFYVGMTRAKDALYLVRALQRGGRGYSESTIPSRFLEDVPGELLNGKSRAGGGGRRGGTGYNPRRDSWTLPSPRQAAPIIAPKFRAGMRVSHPTWEEGIVLDSRIQQDDEIVDVIFESVGMKRLSATLAHLTILK